MLSWSLDATDTTANLLAISDSMADPLLDAGLELRAFTDAAVLRDPHERDIALHALIEAVGEPGARRAAATAGNFEMMNRLLDGIGVGPPDGFVAIAPEIGVAWPPEP